MKKSAGRPNLTAMLAVNLAVLLLGLAGVELAFGSWLKPDNLNALNLPMSLAAHYRADGFYGAEGADVLYARDRYGLRGKYPDPAHIDVLTMGGSTTDQKFIAEGRTWQDVCAARFKDAGRNVSIVNAGVQGQSTIGNLADFKLWFPGIPGLGPRFVLFYEGINDLFRGELPDNKSDRLVVPNPLYVNVLKRSALYYLFRTLRGNYLAYLTAKAGYRGVDFDKERWTSRGLVAGSYDGLMAGQLRDYERRLRALDQSAQGLDARTIFVTQPSNLIRRRGGARVGPAETVSIDGVAVNGVDEQRMLDRLNARTMKVCRDVGGICLDLARDVAFEPGDFYDYWHYTPAGSKKIGVYLYGKLKGEL